MAKTTGLVALQLLSGHSLLGQTPGPAANPGGAVTAFVHVGVIPMDTDRVLEDQTVLVRGSRIVAMGSATATGTAVPAGAARIDGRGKYLIPGLADMHAHVGFRVLLVPSDYKKPPEHQRRQAVESDLFVYAANGVTTVRSVNYSEDDYDPNEAVLRARALAAAGKIWSPRIYTSGKWRKDPQQSIARNLIGYQAAGYDFIKLHNQFDENNASLDSIVATAHLLGLPVMGHVGLFGDSLMHALTAHYASIEHLTSYPGLADPGSGGKLEDTVRLPELIAATQRSGVWNCPTQIMFELWDTLSPEQWPESKRFHFSPLGNGGPLKTADSTAVIRWKLRQRIIRDLQNAGAGLLLGTDAPIEPVGFSVHRELQALVKAGLTPYQALATGTRNVAAYFGKLRDEGTITVGKRADMVLVTGNPLQDIQHTMDPAGVMLGGRWLTRAVIDQRLAALAAARDSAYKAGKLKWP